jgi:hypothetical protein
MGDAPLVSLQTIREVVVVPKIYDEITDGRVDGFAFGMEYREDSLPDGSIRRVYKQT